jgi:hypothetical protein
MDVLSLLNVGSYEVVQSVPCTRNLSSIAKWRILVVETFDGVGVADALFLGHGTPCVLVSIKSERH